MEPSEEFDIANFLPYLLAQAAEVTSRKFEEHYKSQYGMLRTEWRVMFHLGRYGDMTAREISDRASLHKTKISRAVHALQDKRLLSRTTLEQDRRNAVLSLTKSGLFTYRNLIAVAQDFDDALSKQLDDFELVALRKCLRAIAKMPLD